ncbi:hypothetical protein Q8791_23020 [Nocardiopsis sp. CT-R113]|uniref:Uncharacterized protein n=1 Tax=Nocardiopsis codii TaxID=3065942 RepID=A0ABU7KCY0_9ACTN|nr:hypothetical protein [Nocardiopsis sp. CT-R113]MEE2040093.1 hypothetical protein [Nocardiopsis sp. CT-R113]
MSPKPAHVTAAESVVDQLDLYNNRGFVREFVGPTGVAWEQLAAALLDQDTAPFTGRQWARNVADTDRGVLLFAADLALNRWGVDQWDGPTLALARVALRVAAACPVRRAHTQMGTVNVAVGNHTGTLVQAGIVHGGFNL